MAKSTHPANAPACYQCKHGRKFNTPRSVLVEALEDHARLTMKYDSMPWWKLSRPTESDLDRAGWKVADALRALKRYDEHVMCTRFPEHVEKKNRSYCAEFSKKMKP